VLGLEIGHLASWADVWRPALRASLRIAILTLAHGYFGHPSPGTTGLGRPPEADFADHGLAVWFYWIGRSGSGSPDLSACCSGFPPYAPKNAARKMGHPFRGATYIAKL
jgi:hypothetical protein